MTVDGLQRRTAKCNSGTSFCNFFFDTKDQISFRPKQLIRKRTADSDNIFDDLSSLWDTVQSRYATAKEQVFDVIAQAKNLLGDQFVKGFPNEPCRSATILPGALVLSVTEDSQVTAPLSGVLERIVEDEIGAFVVLRRSTAPLAGRYLKLGPLVIADGLADRIGSTLAAKTNLGSISPAAELCRQPHGQSLSVEVFKTALLDTLDDQDLLPLVRVPVLEQLKSLAKIDARVVQNKAYLEVGQSVLIDTDIIDRDFVYDLATPVEAKNQ
jgi:hypothetical protein